MNNKILDDQLIPSRKFNPKFGVVFLTILAIITTRFMPHPPNFTAVGGMALFGAAHFAKKYWAFIIPFLALWISDLVLNNVVYAEYNEGFVLFSSYMVWTYAAFGLVILSGTKFLKKINIPNVIKASVSASLIFFLLTNFGSWYADPFNMFANDFSGLVVALELGLPYFWNTLAGDLFFAGVLFGGFELFKSVYPQVALKPA